jgi:hypothetical protein
MQVPVRTVGRVIGDDRVSPIRSDQLTVTDRGEMTASARLPRAQVKRLAN